MKIGVVKETKDRENRVALTPDGAKILIEAGNGVLIENNAGKNSGFENKEYSDIGAQVVDIKRAWSADMVLKIKEPLEPEYKYLIEGLLLFTYLHLANQKALGKKLLSSKTTGIGYETVEDENGKLPLLAPMSAVAGNMSVTMGSFYLAKFNNGKGMQLGSVLGKKYGKVVAFFFRSTVKECICIRVVGTDIAVVKIFTSFKTVCTSGP